MWTNVDTIEAMEIHFSGEALRRERELKGKSQADVAAFVGCHPKHPYRWEKGYCAPQGRHLAQLLELLPGLRAAA